MSRRGSSGSESTVSLFPFLSVLACIIGTLTLMISALALSGMEKGRDKESVRLAEDHVVLLKRIDRSRKEVAVLEKSMGLKSSLQGKISSERDKLKKLELESEKAKKNTLQAQQLEKQEKELEKQLSKLETQLAELQRKLEDLRKQLVKSRSVMSEATIRVLPPSSGRDIKYNPLFIEARKDEIVVYADPEPYKLPLSGLWQNQKLLDLLDRLSKDASSQIVVLLRKDGLKSMHPIIYLAEGKKIKCGKLPLISDGQLDLSKF